MKSSYSENCQLKVAIWPFSWNWLPEMNYFGHFGPFGPFKMLTNFLSFLFLNCMFWIQPFLFFDPGNPGMNSLHSEHCQNCIQSSCFVMEMISGTLISLFKVRSKKKNLNSQKKIIEKKFGIKGKSFASKWLLKEYFFLTKLFHLRSKFGS